MSASPSQIPAGIPDPGKSKDKSCMPENPFLPETWFGNTSEKMKAHVGIFVAIVVGLRLVGIVANWETGPVTRCQRRF